MTRGYFVLEKSGKIIKGAYINSDAYLQGCGHGNEILEAFASGKEMELMENFCQENITSGNDCMTEGIIPEWYRKTSRSERDDIVSDYAYVLRGKKLYVYYFGRRLFSTDRDHAGAWAEVARKLGRFEDRYIYSEDLLDYDWTKGSGMFRELAGKIESGMTYSDLEKDLRPENFAPAILEDYHTIAAGYTDRNPIYQKRWKKGDAAVTFITEKKGNKWNVCIQLPYIRMPVLTYYTSEKAAVNAIRDLVKEKETEMVRFSNVFQRVQDCMYGKGKLKQMIIDLEEEAEVHPWYGSRSFFSPKKIKRELEK